MEEDDNTDPSKDELLENLRRMRESLGQDPALLGHIETTLDALESIEDPETDDPVDDDEDAD